MTRRLELVNEARREPFCQKNMQDHGKYSSNTGCLLYCQHVGYQAGIWTNSDLAQETPTPEGHGLDPKKGNKSWIPGPVWITLTLPPASQACTELVKCGWQEQEWLWC